MIIDQLPTLPSAIQSGDEIAVERGQQTYKTDVGDALDGKVSKSGDTMTGALYNTANIYRRVSGMDSTSTAEAYSSGQIAIVDKNGRYVGYIQSSQGNSGGTSGDMSFTIVCRKVVNGSNVDNRIDLDIKSNGTRAVRLSDSAAWRSALGLGTNGALPITIEQGGTGATTAENAANTIGAIKRYTINNGSPIPTSGKRRISISSVVLGLLYVCGNATTRCGAYIVYGSASTVIVKPISEATALTVTTGQGYFELHSTSGNMYAIFMTTSPLSYISETFVS